MHKRTISLKLLTTPLQSEGLAALADTFARACTAMVPYVQEHRCWNRVGLHHHAYYTIRTLFPALGSQMVCQALHRVGDAYKTLKANKGIQLNKPIPSVMFRPTSVNFDKRTYSLKGDTLSLFTLAGRQRIPFVGGKHQLNLLKRGLPKEAKLMVRKGTWYFNLVLDMPEVASVSGGILGVDVGENTLAATSTGKVLGGGKLRHHRDKYLAQRRALQSNGSRAAKRKLRIISGREERHVKHTNHTVSKTIVAEALRIGAGTLHLEDLTHIRDNIKAGRRVRTRLHRWAFCQLQVFITYKAQGAGLSVVMINPAYTSQTCSHCGALGKREKHHFSCSCGTRRHADVNAAVNIAGFAMPLGIARGAVSHPVFAHQVPPAVVESSGL